MAHRLRNIVIGCILLIILVCGCIQSNEAILPSGCKIITYDDYSDQWTKIHIIEDKYGNQYIYVRYIGEGCAITPIPNGTY